MKAWLSGKIRQLDVGPLANERGNADQNARARHATRRTRLRARAPRGASGPTGALSTGRLRSRPITAGAATTPSAAFHGFVGPSNVIKQGEHTCLSAMPLGDGMRPSGALHHRRLREEPGLPGGSLWWRAMCPAQVRAGPHALFAPCGSVATLKQTPDRTRNGAQ